MIGLEHRNALAGLVLCLVSVGGGRCNEFLRTVDNLNYFWLITASKTTHDVCPVNFQPSLCLSEFVSAYPSLSLWSRQGDMHLQAFRVPLDGAVSYCLWMSQAASRQKCRGPFAFKLGSALQKQYFVQSSQHLTQPPKTIPKRAQSRASNGKLVKFFRN